MRSVVTVVLAALSEKRTDVNLLSSSRPCQVHGKLYVVYNEVLKRTVMRSMHVCDTIDACDVIDTCDAIDAWMYVAIDACDAINTCDVSRCMQVCDPIDVCDVISTCDATDA